MSGGQRSIVRDVLFLRRTCRILLLLQCRRASRYRRPPLIDGRRVTVSVTFLTFSIASFVADTLLSGWSSGLSIVGMNWSGWVVDTICWTVTSIYRRHAPTLAIRRRTTIMIPVVGAGIVVPQSRVLSDLLRRLTLALGSDLCLSVLTESGRIVC